MYRPNCFFDAIICDPPYGHRAFSRRTGMEETRKTKRHERLKKKYGPNIKQKRKGDDGYVEESLENVQDKSENAEEDDEDIDDKEYLVYNKGEKDSYFFSPLIQCSIEQIFANLLHLGDLCLRLNGLLVCLFPTKLEKIEDDL